MELGQFNMAFESNDDSIPALPSIRSTENFKVTWKNLTLDIHKKRFIDWGKDGKFSFMKTDSKRILHPQSGQFESGTITGLMGPKWRR